MAVIASVTKKEITGVIGMEIIRGTVTTSGDTYASRFGKIWAVIVHDETTLGGAKAVATGSSVAVTCTNGDVVDLLIFGS
jgi:hypothetical protein